MKNVICNIEFILSLVKPRCCFLIQLAEDRCVAIEFFDELLEMFSAGNIS